MFGWFFEGGLEDIVLLFVKKWLQFQEPIVVNGRPKLPILG